MSAALPRDSLTAPTVARLWIVAAILLAALNLRPLFTTTGALMESIRLDLGLSSAAAGLFASIPTLCIGAMALLGGWIIGKVGIGRGMQASLLLIALGSLGRWTGVHELLLYAATFIAGVGIAASQVLIPVVVKQYFQEHVPLVMSGYTAFMNLGAALGAAATPALATQLGGWPAALGVWVVPALLAACFWPGRLRLRRGSEPVGIPWRSALGWRLAGLMTASSSVYTALLAWLVPLYHSVGWPEAEAARFLTGFTIAQIGAALLVPVLTSGRRDRRPAMGGMLLLLLAGLAGMMLMPGTAPMLWVGLIGLGLGAWFALLLILPLDFASTPVEAGLLSAMAVGLGILLSSPAPMLFGALRDAFGFSAALGFLMLMVVLAMVLGVGLKPVQRRSAQN